MTDDIVTRLRGKEHGDNDRRCDSCDEFCCHCELCDCCLEILEVCLVAADEIERLRADRDNWREASERIAHDLEKCDDEIERLRLILTHICDVWGSDLLSIIEEMNRFKKEIK